MNFVFDVDNTLTPTRGKIDSYFEQFFLSFCSQNKVYLVTGSDFPKTFEQMGKDACDAVEGIFNCSGNIYIKKGVEIYRHEFEMTDSELLALKNELCISGFPVRTGNHIEKRIGLVNFSIVGRNANAVERHQYIEWDSATDERNRICQRLNSMFTRFDCMIGGDTGIDISLKGKSKAQVREHINGLIVFFGDKCQPGGNDYPLAKVADIVHNVKNWEETEYLLRMNYGNSFRTKQFCRE